MELTEERKSWEDRFCEVAEGNSQRALPEGGAGTNSDTRGALVITRTTPKEQRDVCIGAC